MEKEIFNVQIGNSILLLHRLLCPRDSESMIKLQVREPFPWQFAEWRDGQVPPCRDSLLNRAVKHRQWWQSSIRWAHQLACNACTVPPNICIQRPACRRCLGKMLNVSVKTSNGSTNTDPRSDRRCRRTGDRHNPSSRPRCSQSWDKRNMWSILPSTPSKQMYCIICYHCAG